MTQWNVTTLCLWCFSATRIFGFSMAVLIKAVDFDRLESAAVKGKVPSRYKYDPIMWVTSQNQMLWRNISTAFYNVSNNHLCRVVWEYLWELGQVCISHVCLSVWEYDVLLKCLDTEWLGYSRREIAEGDMYHWDNLSESGQATASSTGHSPLREELQELIFTPTMPCESILSVFLIEWMFRTLLCEEYHSLKLDVKRLEWE